MSAANFNRFSIGLSEALHPRYYSSKHLVAELDSHAGARYNNASLERRPRTGKYFYWMKNYYDIPRDGGSEVLEQVAGHKAKIEENLRTVRHIVAIGSGKGGVGKSTLSMQIASGLRGQGKRVAVLDADFNAPAQAHLGSLSNAPFIPSHTGVSMPKTDEGIGVVSMGTLLPSREPLNLDSSAPTDSHIWRAAKEFTILGQFLAAVEWGELDLLVVDLPPGTERTVQHAEFLGPRTAFVLVTIPTELARGVVARTISGLTNVGARMLGYVENMSGYCCAGCGTIQPLFASGEGFRFSIPCLGRVPFDPQLAALCDGGESIQSRPDLPGSEAIRALANRVYEVLEDEA